MKMNMTNNQANLYRAIRDYIMAHGESPTVRQMAVLIGVKSASSVVRLLEGMEKRGWVEKLPGSKRGISLRGELVMGQIDLTSPELRDALIAAGWTPPGGHEHGR